MARRAPRCAVPGCTTPAEVEVIHYDLYLDADGEVYQVFFERDHTCGYLCHEHLRDNECRARRKEDRTADWWHRQYVTYPYTNQDHARGISVYRPL